MTQNDQPALPGTKEFLDAGLSVYFFFLVFFFNVYLFLRQRDTEHERGRVSERETQNLKQAPGSELSAQGPDAGLELTDREIVT